jgi:4a-hydroxytetrahydrobiopterin dehydratase
MALLNDTEIAESVQKLPGWQREGDAIVRTFDRGDFNGAVEFLNHVLPLAEAMNHHPDVEISWKDVTMTITSHSAGGLTADDFSLAHSIDAVA